MELGVVLLQAGGASDIMSFLPLVAVGIVFYFFMIRPQAKKAKEQKKFRSEIKKGDRVVTVGGIHGKIKEVNDQTILLETESGRMRIERSAVSMEYTTGGATAAPAENLQEK